jgi:hypothetical protein
LVKNIYQTLVFAPHKVLMLGVTIQELMGQALLLQKPDSEHLLILVLPMAQS